MFHIFVLVCVCFWRLLLFILFCCCVTLKVLKSMCQIFCRMSLNLDFFSWWLGWVAPLTTCNQLVMVPLITWLVCQICPVWTCYLFLFHAFFFGGESLSPEAESQLSSVWRGGSTYIIWNFSVRRFVPSLHVFIYSITYLDQHGLCVFMLYSGLHSSTPLFCCSNYPSSGYWELFQAGSYVPLTHPILFI